MNIEGWWIGCPRQGAISSQERVMLRYQLSPPRKPVRWNSAPYAAMSSALSQGGRDCGSTMWSMKPWLSAEDIAAYGAEFQRTGFRGGLNWYRNITRSWELMAPWRGQPIRQPSMFIAGARDGVLKFPNAKAQIDNYSRTLPGLRGCHIVDGAGHWIQREKAEKVNALLIDFLQSL